MRGSYFLCFFLAFGCTAYAETSSYENTGVIEEGKLPATKPIRQPWYVGVGGGIFDVDYDDGRRPHFESTTINGFVGYDISHYLSVELFVAYAPESSARDDDSFRSLFGGTLFSPALLVKYPLDRVDLLEVYVRLGGSYIDYTIATPELGGRIDDTIFQQNLGVGIRSKSFFLEYVNYGEIESLYLEQIRLGVRLRF